MSLPKFRSTTVIAVKKDGKVAMAGDGQVTMGETVMKGNARKVRRIFDGKVLTGFAGATANAFNLFDKFEAKLKEFKYQKLDYQMNNQITLESKIILDIVMANQNGLSMRTFESLGYHKKIITTNKNVLNYDFYRPENIYYYDGNEIDFNNIFFTSEYVEVNENILRKYSLDNWIDKMFMED